MRLNFGGFLIIIFAIIIAINDWSNITSVVTAICIIAITIIDTIYRTNQFERYLKKQDLEELKKKIDDIINNSDEFKRVRGELIKSINKQP